MNALFYILYRSLINMIKQLFRKPAALIAYILVAAFFIGTFLLSNMNNQGTSGDVDIAIVKAIIVGYTVFLFVIAFSTSLGGTSFFRMADVNMLFTSPLKSGHILVYGFVKQLAANVMIMLFLALQYPNWRRMFGLPAGAGWILIITYLLLVALTSLLGMILYAYVSKKPHRTALVKKVLYLAIAVFLAPIALGVYKTGDIVKSGLAWLSNDELRFIPLIGWFREMLLGSFTGMTTSVLFYTVLIIGIILVAFIYLYRMDTGFYEHVLSGTELRETMVKTMREGKSGVSNVNRTYRKAKARFTMEGSLAIFQKQLLERRKTGVWLISTKSIILLILGIIAAVSIQVDALYLMTGILIAFVYLMLIFTMVGTWEGELSKHYIYLIPEAPFGKMLSATLPEIIKLGIEGFLVFGIVGIILKVSIWIVVSMIAAYVTIGAVFTYSDLVVRRIFGRIHGNILRIFFRIFLLILILTLVVTPAVLILVFTGSYAFGFLVASGINMLLVLVFMWVGLGLFKSPELP